MDSFNDLFVSDQEKAENGVEVPIGVNANGDDIILYVAEAGSARHEKVTRKYSKQLERARPRTDAFHLLMARVVAEGLLVNWDGVLDSNGNEVDATLENKIEALTKYKKLYLAVLEAANDETLFRPDDKDDTEKN